MPEYCSAHSDLMIKVGELTAYQRNTAEDVQDIKKILVRWEEEAKVEQEKTVELRTKTKLLWGGLGVATMAGISAGVSFLFKKFGG